MNHRFTRLIVCLLAAAAAGGQEREPGKGVNFYTKQKEAALGKQMAEDVRRRSTILDNKTVTDYVRSIGALLIAEATGDKPDLNIEVIVEGNASVIHEPLALPGGYIFVRSGLFMAAHSEADFAAMLAHAIAHVVERHGTRSATRVQTANMASIPLIFMDANLVPQSMLPFVRAQELEADKLAVKLMANAGYDPAALIRYISRVQIDRPIAEQSRSALPPRDERIAALTEAIRALPAETYETTNAEFTRARDEVKRLMNQPPQPVPSLRKTPEQP